MTLTGTTTPCQSQPSSDVKEVGAPLPDTGNQYVTQGQFVK